MTSPIRTPGSLLLQLRQATQQAHLRVERHALLASLLSSGLDLPRYLRILRAFHAYYQTLEPGLSKASLAMLPTQSAGYHYIPRAEILAEDMQDIQGSHSPESPRPDSKKCAVRRTPGHILGWLYVLEGATQGGRIIAPRVSRELGLSVSYGARYFNLYQQGQWRSFQALVEGCQASPEVPGRPDVAGFSEAVGASAAIEGALDAFDSLTTYMDAWIRV
ncbi:biliverdin-producing heme oxygenase [Hydrocarboniclastica marina]|uniref:Biliverdin-producing heme oxygenase n=1 Tax=Hydrocarboniclastica marina TaxID=2259620 RepID=A0A4P7XET7_9ALTE|nr:biliverdin-producing heme oxygenase [Hydrocarboniclastica marina]QCF24904.1 hypothetical protein soil367_02485 [Hydrocarboniclastica marina]